MHKPLLTREQIAFFIYRFRKFDVTKREQRQRLIDSFVNAVYLYEDKIILTFNYKDGSKTITLAEVEGSDLSVLGAPRRSKVRFAPTFFYSCGIKEHHPPASLRLLSKPNPLRWASAWDGGSAAVWEKSAQVGENQKLEPYRRALARRYGRCLLGKNQTFSGSG